jgi:predicted acetyltransferase
LLLPSATGCWWGRRLAERVRLTEDRLHARAGRSTTAVHESFVAAWQEFAAEGRGTSRTRRRSAATSASGPQAGADPDTFARYVDEVVADALPDSPRPEGYVPMTTLWWIESDVYLARIAIRHRLTPWLLEQGGHIGYDVRPSARRQGHATAMLRAALPVVAGLGIRRALVTCDHDNVGSRKVIEACGGVFEDRRADKLRYWIETDG